MMMRTRLLFLFGDLHQREYFANMDFERTTHDRRRVESNLILELPHTAAIA